MDKVTIRRNTNGDTRVAEKTPTFYEFSDANTSHTSPDLYPCDPEKNTECPKTHCHINGGDCRLTTHRKYRRKK